MPISVGGGFSGYIIGTIIPNEKSLKILPVALAHEANHNVRWQFMKWSNKITLGDMIVSDFNKLSIILRKLEKQYLKLQLYQLLIF